MKLEVGRKYRAENGCTIEVLAIDNRVAFTRATHNGSSISSYCLHNAITGRVHPAEDFVDFRVISEIGWRNEIPWGALRPEIKWVAMDGNGVWYGYTDKPDRHFRDWCCPNRYYSLAGVAMPTPPSFRESLAERPEGS